MLDTARNLWVDFSGMIFPWCLMHFSFPVSDIKRTLDAMSWVKVTGL